jgi:RNA polymerase sigma-70 factor (sigma-E family)
VSERAEPALDSADDLVAFCERLRPRLVGMLSLYTADPGVAEELAQETLARVWANWDKVRQMHAPGGWTYRVAVNLANSAFRRRGAERRARERLVARGGVAGLVPHTDPDTPDTIAVRRAVAALPPRQRTVVVLRYYADLPVDEVARAMGCAEGTVKSLMHRAVQTLRTSSALAEEVSDGA